MRIQVDNPDLIDEFLSYLKECSCEVARIRGTSFDAYAPAAATDPGLAKLQLDGFLKAWAVRHPEAVVSVHKRLARQASSRTDLTESVSCNVLRKERSEVDW